jgi:uncharacterized protein
MTKILPLWVGFALVLAHLVLRFVIGGALASALGVDPEAYDGAPALFAILAVMVALEAAVFIWVLRARGSSLAAIGWRAPPVAWDVVLGMLGFAVCLVTMTLSIAPLAGGVGLVIDDLVQAVVDYTPAQRAFFAVLGLVAAFTEETVFRGVLQPSLQRRLGRWPGLVVGAVIFAAYHLQFHPVLLLGKTLFGITYGWLRDRTGTLWAPAIAPALVWIVVGAA